MTAGFPIRRMLFALDHSPAARSALPEALRLATRLHAEAEGLFVEDSRLMSICAGDGMPLRHVSTVTGLDEVLDSRAMEAALRAQSVMLSRHVAAIARMQRCSCVLRTVRGRVAETLVSETAADDLLVLSRRPGHVGAVLAATLRGMSAPVLVLPPGETPDQGRIVVITDDAGFLGRGLAAAERFMNGTGRVVEVLLGGALTAAEAAPVLDAAALPARVTVGSGQDDLAGQIRSDTGLIIASPKSARLTGPQLTLFLESVSKPVLMLP